MCSSVRNISEQGPPFASFLVPEGDRLEVAL